MLTKTKFVLAAALILGTASAALAGGSDTHKHRSHHYRGDHAAGLAFGSVRGADAFAASRPSSGCHNSYNYDRALDGYSYDLICNGVDVSPH